MAFVERETCCQKSVCETHLGKLCKKGATRHYVSELVPHLIQRHNIFPQGLRHFVNLENV